MREGGHLHRGFTSPASSRLLAGRNYSITRFCWPPTAVWTRQFASLTANAHFEDRSCLLVQPCAFGRAAARVRSGSAFAFGLKMKEALSRELRELQTPLLPHARAPPPAGARSPNLHEIFTRFEPIFTHRRPSDCARVSDQRARAGHTVLRVLPGSITHNYA